MSLNFKVTISKGEITVTKTWTEVWYFREALYGSLAKWFLEVIRDEEKELLTPQFWHEFPIEPANSHIKSGLENLSDVTSEMEEINSDAAMEMVMAEYTKLFLGPGVPKAPIVESYYLTNHLFFGPSTLEMKQLLNKHGLESKLKDRHPEDHIGLQFLFLSMQSEKLTDLDEIECIEILNEQKEFIDHHLLSWIPALFEKASEHGDIGFYSGVIELVWGILLWDKELIQEFIDSYDYVTQK